MHIEFLSISEVAAGKRHDFISKKGKAFAHWSRMTVSTRDRLHNSSFFSNQHTRYHIDFALFINNSGRTWKTNWFQHNIYIFISISISSVRRLGHCTTFVDTQYVVIIEEKKQQIKELQEELAEFNCVRYRTLPGNASRGKNILRTSKKMSMTATDHINQQAVASYVRKAIWPGNKMLPKNWSKWRDDKRSLCQLILKKLHYLLVWMESHTGRQWY